MTSIRLSVPEATYSNFPSRLRTIPRGRLPTGIVVHRSTSARRKDVHDIRLLVGNVGRFRLRRRVRTAELAAHPSRYRFF